MAFFCVLAVFAAFGTTLSLLSLTIPLVLLLSGTFIRGVENRHPVIVFRICSA